MVPGPSLDTRDSQIPCSQLSISADVKYVEMEGSTVYLMSVGNKYYKENQNIGKGN